MRRKNKIRILLKSFDHYILEKSVEKIIASIRNIGATIAGPIPLPTEISRYTVLSSPFVNKDSRDQYEIRVYKRLIDIYNPTPNIVDGLMHMEVQAGVNIEIKIK